MKRTCPSWIPLLCWLAVPTLASAGEDVAATMKKADALFQERRYEQSLELFRKVADEHPGAPQAPEALLMTAMCYDNLASRSADASTLDKELAALSRLIEKYPKSPRTADAYLYRGQLRMGAPDRVPPRPGDYAKAMQDLSKAAELADRDWLKAQAEGRIGECLEELGRADEARAAYQDVLRKYPGTPFAGTLRKELDPSSGLMMERAYDLLSQGGQLLQQGRHEESLKLFETVAADYPYSPHAASEALLLAGVDYDWLAAQRKDPSLVEKERETLMRLVDKYPASPRAADAYLYLGQVASGHAGFKPKSVDLAKAMELYAKAAAKADRDWIKAQAKGRIGQCLESLGRKDEARAAYQEVVRSYPGEPWSAEARKLLERLKGG